MRPPESNCENASLRCTDALLRGVMLWLFAAGVAAIVIIWSFEAHFGLLDALCRTAYPIMLAVFVGSAAMLYRWPGTIGIARWAGFGAINTLLFVQFFSALRGSGPLAGNYAFISMLMWLPLAYAISLLMLEVRQAPWAAGAMLAAIAATSIEQLTTTNRPDPGDLALLVNLLASHLVLLACLSGLIKFRLALAKADADSRRFFAQASTDPLTGLSNRRHGVEMLRQAEQQYRPDEPSAVILCDIDHFKAINDNHGHDVGDRLMLGIARVLQSSTRDIDTVVRWGGDEFLIVIPDISAPALVELTERLRTRAGTVAQRVGDQHVAAQLSLGVAARNADESLANWIKRADQALYQAKAQGRNRCVFAPSHGAPEPLAADEHAPLQLEAE